MNTEEFGVLDKMRVKLIFILSALVYLQSCSAVTIVDAGLVGECKVIMDEQFLLSQKKKSSYFDRFLITDDKTLDLPWGTEILGVLNEGTRVVVDSVLQDRNGSWGKYYRIQVQVISGPFSGIIADIPSCAPNHPRPSWLSCDASVEKIQFVTKVLEDC